MKITVTQKDIDFGIPATASRCPLALAFQRATGTECLVSHAVIDIGRTQYLGDRLPEKAHQFLRDFDGGEPVFPFSFEFVTKI